MNVSGISYGHIVPFDIEALRKNGGNMEEAEKVCSNLVVIDKDKFLNLIHNSNYISNNKDKPQVQIIALEDILNIVKNCLEDSIVGDK